jgi:hypothetical protein
MSPRPVLLVRVELELPLAAIVLATTSEDEERLRVWLSSPAACRHVLQAVEDALDELSKRRAA